MLTHAALLALLAPALDGLVHQVAARYRGEAGPPPYQPWRDLLKYWRKPARSPAAALLLFAATPAVALGAAFAAALLVPGFALGTATAPLADLVVVVGLLALSRAAPALAAYDVGAAQAAYAGARVTAARLPAEPVLLLVALVAFTLSGSTNLDATALRDGVTGLRLPGALAALAVLAVVAEEPPTPAVFSGRHLALVTAAAQLRRVAGLSLAAILGLPFGLAAAAAGPYAWIFGIACWVLKLGLLGGLAAALPRHRALLPAAALLALIAAVALSAESRM